MRLTYILFLTAISLHAATVSFTVTQQSTCSFSLITTITNNTGSCTLGAGSPGAFAETNSSLFASGNTLTLAASGIAGANGEIGPGLSIFASSQSSTTTTGFLFFAGPVRPAWVEVFDSNALSELDGSANVDFSLNSQTLISDCSNQPCYPPRWQSVMIGGAVPFSYTVSAGAFSLDTTGGGQFLVNSTLQFLEVDQITPIDFVDAPEPAALALALVGFGLVGYRRIGYLRNP